MKFARRAGLPRDTVRFYVRLGLLRPRLTQKGGRHPYLIFGDDDVRSAAIIRVGQALGLSLREIAGLRQERRKGKLPLAERIALMKSQLARLEAKAAELEKLRAYVKAKIAWQEGGEAGPEPSLDGCL